jgi:hypothetical protein
LLPLQLSYLLDRLFRIGAIFTAQFLMSLRGVSERRDTLTTNTKAATLTTVFLTFDAGIESAYPMSDLASAGEIASDIRERDVSID